MNKRNKRSIILGSLAAAIGIVLILLPFGIKYGAVRALLDQGVERAYIDDVDFNLFTGILAIKGLKLTEGGGPSLEVSRLQVELSWMQLFKKRFYIEEVLIDEFKIKVREINETSWSVGGITVPPETEEVKAETEPVTWGYGIGKFKINKSAVNLQSSDLKALLLIEKLMLSGAKSWEPDSSATFQFSGNFNDAGIDIISSLQPFAESPGLKGSLILKDLSLEDFSAFLPPEIESIKGILNIESDLEARLDDTTGIQASHKGMVALNDAEVMKSPLLVKNSAFEWKGRVDFSKNNEEDEIRLIGDMFIENLGVSDQDEKLVLVDLKRVDVSGINVKAPDDIKISNIDFGVLVLGKSPGTKESSDIEARPVFSTNNISIADISSDSPYDLFIKTIFLKDMNVGVLKSQDERMHVIDDITDLFKEKGADDSKEEEVKEEGKEIIFGIGAFRISEKSGVQFDDESVAPPYRVKLDLNNISFYNMDNSVAENKMKVVLDAGIGEYTKLIFAGNIQPFVERMNVEIKGEIKEMDLSPVSPYAIKALGYNVTSGHLNADVVFNVVSGEILGENAITMKKLKITPTDDDKIESLAAKLSISLDTTLELLRDKEGNIKIKIPVDGDISDPHFDFQDVINKALLTATKKTAFSFLKKAFVPYGTLITVVEMAGKAARIKLDPLFFEPGSVESAQSMEYLERLVTLMDERPEIQISICGKAVTADRVLMDGTAASVAAKVAGGPQEVKKPDSDEKEGSQPLAGSVGESLLNLAKERSEVIKRVLVEKFGIETGRLFICNPEIDEGEGAKPRAELLI